MKNKETYIGIWNGDNLITISEKEYEYLKFVANEIANNLVVKETIAGRRANDAPDTENGNE